MHNLFCNICKWTSGENINKVNKPSKLESELQKLRVPVTFPPSSCSLLAYQSTTNNISIVKEVNNLVGLTSRNNFLHECEIHGLVYLLLGLKTPKNMCTWLLWLTWSLHSSDIQSSNDISTLSASLSLNNPLSTNCRIRWWTNYKKFKD